MALNCYNNFIAFNNFINAYFFSYFNQINFLCIISLTILHSNTFLQFSIFFSLLINNRHKVFMTNFIIYQNFRYFSFYTIQFACSQHNNFIIFFVLFIAVFNSFFYNSYRNWKCKTRTCTHHSRRCSNNNCKWCNRMLPVATNKTMNDL